MQGNALPISMEALLQGRVVEDERLEFKKGWNPKAVLHTLCAFANDFHNLGGGYIVVGIEEIDGRPQLPPVGLDPKQIDAIQQEMVQLGYNAIKPTYHPRCIPVTYQDKDILVIWAFAGETRPYKAKADLGKNNNDWREYIRRHSSTIVAKDNDWQELNSIAATVPFDDRYNQFATLDDLSPRFIEEFLRKVGSDLADQAMKLPMETLGRQMNIVGGPSESPFVKNIGLIMFSEQPDKFFPYTQIDVVYFPDGPGGDTFEEKEFKGPMSRIVYDALSHIERNYLRQTVIKYPDRAEADRIWNYPYAAIEEALANAVYHRSYEIREPVEIRISPEDLVVLSYPGPDYSINIDDIAAGKAVSRHYRNRRIGEFLKELELTEGRSTGINKIKRATARNKSPDPSFESNAARTYFITRIPVHPQAIQPTNGFEGIEKPETEQSAVRTSGDAEATPQVAPQATPQVAKLLAVISGEMGRDEIQSALGLKARRSFRDSYISPALANGWIEMTQPEVPQSPTQKYRLTETGKEILKSLGDE